MNPIYILLPLFVTLITMNLSVVNISCAPSQLVKIASIPIIVDVSYQFYFRLNDSGITVGLQQTTYNTPETGGLLKVCVEMFVGSLERNVTISLTSSDNTAVGKMLQTSNAAKHLPNNPTTIQHLATTPFSTSSLHSQQGSQLQQVL